MKSILWLTLALAASPIMAGGVYVDDIEYQDWVDYLMPHYSNTISAIESAKNAADETDTVDPGTTTEAFCDILFPTSGDTAGLCDTAGEKYHDIADSLQSLSNRSSQMYNCATDGACNAASRLTGLRKHTNEALGVQLDADAAKYQQMFNTMVGSARTLLNTLLASNIVNDLADQVEGAKTAAALCNQWFAPNEIRDCTVGGGTDREINITQALIDASGAMDDLFDCANNVACGTGDRLTDLRQFVEIQ